MSCSACCAPAPVMAPGSPPEKWWPVVLAILLAGLAELAGLLDPTAFAYAGYVAPALALGGIMLAGTGVFAQGWRGILAGKFDINALMALAVTGACVLRQWPEAAMVMALFTLAERLESRAVARARHAIGKLLEMAPEIASVARAGGWQDCRVEDIMPGEIVRVRPGERIALDGDIVRGRSAINQAAITGESLPVEKAEGDAVFAGTLNETGLFEFRVTATTRQTLLARIVTLVEEAENSKAPTERFIDRFARYYTPGVVLFAALVAVIPPLFFDAAWRDCIYRALVLLVISCPCALVISTPVAIVSGLTRAARMGILIKGGGALEMGKRLTHLAFDKTGTLTIGQPRCTDHEVFVPEEDRILAAALSLAAASDHPVSRALAQEAALQSLPRREVAAFTALPGSGIEGEIAGERFILGNRRTVEGKEAAHALARAEALERQGKTVVFLSDTRRVLALFAVADRVRAESAAAIAELRRLGMTPLLLTGDNAATAAAIAVETGIEAVHSELLPEDKHRLVGELKAEGKNVVGMIGDGINDAPALAAADIGFAMGVMGTDTALEAADVALMDDDLGKIPRFIRLARATHAILTQNIAIALVIKGIFFILALTGIASMWVAVFADVGATLIVVANGLRLTRGGWKEGGMDATIRLSNILPHRE